MSGLEVAAAVALGAAYLDAKLEVVGDLVRMKQLAHAQLSFYNSRRTGKVSTFNSFVKWARIQPDKLFIVYPEPVSAGPDKPLEKSFIMRRYTYSKFLELAQRYSAYLVKEHGIKEGDIVAIDFINKPEMLVVWFALWNIGATPALINYNLIGKSLLHCVRVSQSRLFVVDEEVAQQARSVSDTLKSEDNINSVLATKEHFSEIFETYPPIPFRNPKVSVSDPACYIFTSGTTGLPKAANFSWKKANWGSLLYANVSFYSRNDVLYSAMPLYHSTAAALGLLAILQKGGTYAIGHKFSTSTFWMQARLCDATSIQYVGETGRYLLNAPPTPDDTNHKVTVAHGNGMRPDVWLKFKERFNIGVISEFYGATEFPTAITNFQRGAIGVGACGHYGTLASITLRKSKWNIAKIDPDTQELYRDPKTGFCKQSEVNEPGEFLFHLDPKNIKEDFQGYAGNKKATEEKIAVDVFQKGDAWVRSGDLLKFDEYNSIYFVDRLGDTFRWKSENVSTNEVEEAISEIPDVDLAVCVGVKVPQHEGRAGFAVIKLKDPSKKLDMKHVAQHLSSSLPRYAIPVFIKFIDSVSITGNNKVQKKLFREQKIPAPPNEVIYWLIGNEYVPLTAEHWARVEQGSYKL